MIRSYTHDQCSQLNIDPNSKPGDQLLDGVDYTGLVIGNTLKSHHPRRSTRALTVLWSGEAPLVPMTPTHMLIPPENYKLLQEALGMPGPSPAMLTKVQQLQQAKWGRPMKKS